MKIINMERVQSIGDGTSNWLATFDAELDDGTLFANLALIEGDGRRELTRRENLAPVLAARILAAASDEYDRAA